MLPVGAGRSAGGAGRCGPVLGRHGGEAGGTKKPSASAQDLVDDFIVVDTDAVCAAIKDIFVDTRSIVEPAGALAVAAIKQYVAKHQDQGRDLRRHFVRCQHEF